MKFEFSLKKMPVIKKLILSLTLMAFFILGTSFSYIFIKISKNFDTILSEKLTSIATSASELIPVETHQKLVAKILSGEENIENSLEFKSIQNILKILHHKNKLNSDLLTLIIPEIAPDAMMFVAMSAEKPYIGNGMPVSHYVKSVWQNGEVIKTGIYSDKEGEWVSAFSPIKDKNNKVVAVVEADFHPFEIVAAKKSLLIILFTCGAFSIFCLLLGTYFLKKTLNKIIGQNIYTIDGAISNVRQSLQDINNDSQKSITLTKEQDKSIQDVFLDLQNLVKDGDEGALLVENSSKLGEISVESSIDTEMAMNLLIKAFNETLLSLEKTLEQLKNDSLRIAALSEKIEAISLQTEAIIGIALQSKILSFNAMVEAKRAGESGKGFAVVAEAIASLAELSDRAAKSITEIVKISSEESKNISQEAQLNVTKNEKELILIQEYSEQEKIKAQNSLEKLKESVINSNEQTTKVKILFMNQLTSLQSIRQAMNLIQTNSDAVRSISEVIGESTLLFKNNTNEVESAAKQLENAILGENLNRE